MADEHDFLDINENDVAIVGMAAHVPGAHTINEYWENLRQGTESISHLSADELQLAGEDPGKILHKNYVPAAAILDGFKNFDADFFGFSPKEAAIMDPQHRKFLEESWNALENAGHPPEKFNGRIGVYAGCGMGSYFYFNICSNPDLVADTGMFLLRHTGNDKDFMATRVSHIFDLKGPSINLQTACSTSLVATHYACQALLTGECDMALAGGSTIELPHGRGYIFEDGEILSPDGHCHAFDHRAQGTVFGSGAGVVVLRRLADAIADGDHIWGVIKGSAINNDGAAKAGYLAPSVDGQAAAIAEAQMIAGVSADSVGYVECHGTGTYLGDPIEVAALSEAFSQTTDETGFCRIGSVKTNIGHLDTAAGVASLIKTALSLYHKEIPPSLGFEKPNPAIDFDNSPFQVNAELFNWVSDVPRRAGVNSLGVGGTNAHVVLQEAPPRAPSDPSDWPFHLLTVSGRSKVALDANAAALAAHLRAHPEQPLADVAFTLKEGRRAFEHRRVVVAETHTEAADLLEGDNPRRVFSHTALGKSPEVVFMFPGGGAQYVGMARDLYETEPVFQEWMDRGLDILQPKLDYDIRALWLPENDAEQADELLKKPSVQLPLIMITEYALAQLWMSWGVQPAVLVGHSMGENTAACLAGVIGFEDCIGLVHLRGQLFDTVPAGGMLSIPQDVETIREYLGETLDLASVNAPELSVVSGPDADLDALQQRLQSQGIECQRVAIDIAAHSRMLEPILQKFGDYLRGISLSAPSIPFLSNRTGDYISDAQATDPEYWVSHLRNTILFADCMTTLAQKKDRVYLEVGPGKALSSLSRMHPEINGQQVLASLRHPDEKIADDMYFLGLLGRLWALGVEIDWAQIWGEAKRQRVVLPNYAFQRAEYFIEPGQGAVTAVSSFLSRTDDPAKWGYRPVWRPRLADCVLDVANELDQAEPQTWLLLMDEIGLGDRLATALRKAGHDVIELRTGDAFARVDDRQYIIAPERGREGFDQLFHELLVNGTVPSRVVNLWLLTMGEDHRPGSSFFHRNQEQGFYTQLFLAQAIAEENLPTPVHMTVVTSGAVQLRDEGLPYPEKATVAGPCRVIPREMPGVTCAILDVDIAARLKNIKPRNHGQVLEHLAFQVLEDLVAPAKNTTAVLRAEKRFEQEFVPLALSEKPQTPVYKSGGTYLITGGFGGIGLTLAEQMIRTANANVVLLARTPLPDRAHWSKYLRSHGPNDETAIRIRAVQALERFGGTVRVAVADVCNLQEMSETIASVQERVGPINGVVHAAGVVDDAPFLAKNPSAIEDVFAPKIHGTQILHQLFPDGVLDWLVLFSSTSTVIAPAGQVDYVAANEYLNAYAASRKSDKTRVLAINWGIWNEVGMAAQAVARRVGDIAPAPIEKTAMPLLDQASFDAQGNRIFSTRFSLGKHWVFDEHRTISGDAILPGTGFLELAAEALRAHGEDGAFEIRDLLFLRPLQLEESSPRDMRLTLARSGVGYAMELRSDCILDGRKGWQLNAQASLSLVPLADAAPINPAEIFARCETAQVAPAGGSLRSPQENHLQFGPRWRVLQRLAYGAGEGIAELALPEQAVADIENGYLLHPALLDLATGWAMELIDGYQPTHLWVPVSYGRVQVFQTLPARIYSWVRNAAENTADTPFARFDITLCDENGTVCLEISDFAIKRLDAGFATPRLNANEVRFEDDASGEPAPLSPAEQRLQHNLSQGITPSEGAAAFIAAFGTELPQVIVSSLPLPALIAQNDKAAQEQQAGGQKFERPELESDFAEPSNDIERTLAGFWQDLLGVERVGVNDSFFDLGGHSLIAVRLFSMIKKAYQVDFPISILFEAPTIAKCAELIGEKVGFGTETKTPDEPTAAPLQRFTHLVAMHEGEGGTQTPFFLVAGMFGNVLNLRHLGHLIGADRPFYGLQARGLYGDEAPHTDMKQTAADYIAEMRMVQPHGPYLLGGFSGGGITAYEIAQQLKQQGEEVALLVMLDTPLPQRRPLARRDRMMIHWLELKKKGIGYLGQWVSNRIKWELAKRRPNEAPSKQQHQFHDTEIEAAFLQSVAQYSLQPWDGPLVLFRPPLQGYWQVSADQWIDRQRAYVFADNDWGQWASQLQVFEVPGDHDSMVLEPNVRVLAARIKSSIEAVEKTALINQVAGIGR